MTRKKTPGTVVAQSGPYIAIIGPLGDWRPSNLELAEHGASAVWGDQTVTLTFKTTKAAKATFGAMFGDGALGVDDLPDDTTYRGESLDGMAG